MIVISYQLSSAKIERKKSHQSPVQAGGKLSVRKKKKKFFDLIWF